MDDTTILGGALNQLGQAAKQMGQQAVKLPGQMVQDAGKQIAGTKPVVAAEESDENDKNKTAQPQQQWQSDQERVDFLKKLYGSEDRNSSNEKPKTNQTSANPLVSAKEKPTEFQEQIADKTPEEQKNLMQLRDQLHKEEYYDPTFNPPKKQEEERPAEKVEKEKKQEMAELQEKEEKKPPPLAVQREQNKAEMFRGAAG